MGIIKYPPFHGVVQSTGGTHIGLSDACDMGALVGTIDAMKADRYLAQHARYYYREVRVMAYTQFMESYRTVSLASMASSFGVSPQYMDKELSAFISAGRLSCKLDAVAGVVNSTRPDAKSAQYLATIKQVRVRGRGSVRVRVSRSG